MKYWIFAATIWFTVQTSAQSPFKPQLAVPVYYNNHVKSSPKALHKATDTYFSGIALLFVDTANTSDELFVTSGGDLVIWHDNVGRSTKTTFIVPDSQFIGRVELTYFEGKCRADIWWQDRNSADNIVTGGDLVVNDKMEYALNLDLDIAHAQKMGQLFNSLNEQLMVLHTRSQRRVAIKSWFNKDSINIIVGSDSQFDVDNDLFWLDQNLRNRLQSVATNAFSKLFLFNNQHTELVDSVKSGNRKLIHRAERKGNGIVCQLSVQFKPDNSTRYVFLKPFQTYELTVDYTFVYAKNRSSELSIQRFALRNRDTGDFVDMDIYDFVNNGLPVMYVDLIRGVVTANDAWDITNVIHTIEDVVGASRLPLE